MDSEPFFPDKSSFVRFEYVCKETGHRKCMFIENTREAYYAACRLTESVSTKENSNEDS